MHVCIMLPNSCIVVRHVSMNYMLDFVVSVREYYIRYWLYVHDTSTIVTLSTVNISVNISLPSYS